jgi:hypothetical protein
VAETSEVLYGDLDGVAPSSPEKHEEDEQSMMRLTQSFGDMPIAVLRRFALFAPAGVRPRPECAYVVTTKDYTRRGYVQLKYLDKKFVFIPITALSHFEMKHSEEVTKKLMLAKPGDFSVNGNEAGKS